MSLSVVLLPTRECFARVEMTQFPVKGCKNVGLSSAPTCMSPEQGEIFIVSHLLWHGTSVFAVCNKVDMKIIIRRFRTILFYLPFLEKISIYWKQLCASSLVILRKHLWIIYWMRNLRIQMQKSRKRTPNEEQWKKNYGRRQRQSGKDYKDWKGIIQRKRKVKKKQDVMKNVKNAM